MKPKEVKKQPVKKKKGRKPPMILPRSNKGRKVKPTRKYKVQKEKLNEFGLTIKQSIFCREYIFDWNASRAYRIAYPMAKDSSVGVCANQNLNKPNIQAYIEFLQRDLEKLVGVSKEMVLREHYKLAFSSIAHLHNTWIERKEFDELTNEQKACIEEISTQTRTVFEQSEDKSIPVQVEFIKIKLYDKQKSLEAISRMLSYNAPEKSEVGIRKLKDINVGFE